VSVAGDLVVDVSAEQPAKEAVLAAADDDHVRVLLVRNPEQPVGRITDLGDVLGLDVAPGEIGARVLELRPRQILG